MKPVGLKPTRLKPAGLKFAALALSVLLFVTACGAPKVTDEDTLEPGVIFQDEAAAREADVTALAAEANLDVAAVRDAIAFQEAFADYADGLLSRYPNKISAVWVEAVPATQGHIQFVGAVPADVATGLATQSVLTGSNLVLGGNGGISLEEHLRRAALAAEALTGLGYQNYLTYFDPTSGVIQAEVQVPAGAPQPSAFRIVNAAQALLQAARDDGALQLQGGAASFALNDLNLKVQVSEGPFAALDHSRGGNVLLDDGARECTSGWSVSGPNGDGIITAAHCTGLNQFEQPGLVPYGMSWKNQVWGAGGDAEYHTTTHVELAEFYADAFNIRDVTGTRSTASMVGGSVCLYGRFSNNRTCTHQVTGIGATLNFSGRVVSNLAITDTTSSVPGDSGGGWSFNNTAWGVNTGRILTNPPQGIFTPVRQAEAVLGVTVKTK
ncbi:hypothetical protein BH24DEI2_BH24DEI2_00530 [soil metagenome]